MRERKGSEKPKKGGGKWGEKRKEKTREKGKGKIGIENKQCGRTPGVESIARLHSSLALAFGATCWSLRVG